MSSRATNRASTARMRQPARSGAGARHGRASGRLARLRDAIPGTGAMKGVVLAGGLGTRLAPMTHVANKHVLDLYDEPMIHFPVRTLARAGVTELVVVVGRYGEQVRAVLGDGAGLGVSIEYAHRGGAAGTADAL